MSQATVRQMRRDLRRAVGTDALATIGELQANVERIGHSVTLAHNRLDAQGEHLMPHLDADRLHLGRLRGLEEQMLMFHDFTLRTFWQRLRWLCTGR